MNWFKKVLSCMLLATMVTVGTVNKAETQEVWAGCTRPGRTVSCVGPMSTAGVTSPHLIYNSESGTVYCGVVTEQGRHDLYCDFCYEYVESVDMIHSRYHSICADELYICQSMY